MKIILFALVLIALKTSSIQISLTLENGYIHGKSLPVTFSD